jgi:LacI family transcriptional regulator
MVAVRKMNYHINTVARALKSQRKTALGFISFWHLSINPTEAYYQQTLTGVINGISRSKYHLLLNNIHGLLNEENRELDFFHESFLAGVIMVAPRVEKKDLVFLKNVNIPVVLLFFRTEGKEYCWVDLDNKKGAQLAVEHLVGLGHKRIGFIGGELEHSSNAKDRYAGYLKALKAAGIAEKPELVKHGFFSYGFGQEGAQQLLSLPKNQRPTAIFCATDMTAFGAIDKAASMGLKVPEDLSIVGFDDYERAALNNPPLTTIRQPFHEIGRKAVELLEAIVQNPRHKSKQVLLIPELVVRKSTAPPAANS